MDEQQKRQAIFRLEELGESKVRLLHSSDGFPSGWRLVVTEWLAEKDDAEKRRTDASQVEQARTALSAKNAAWAAAIAAIVAAIIAIIGALISWLAWLWPHTPG